MDITVEIAQSCTGLSRATIQKHIRKGDYKSRLENQPNGGAKRFIALDSLPQEAQDRYWAQVRAQQEA
ncbi:MAG: hypothetical protein Q4F00_13185, partial [bacterium]|nr:hypothetical protein [bacterium]